MLIQRSNRRTLIRNAPALLAGNIDAGQQLDFIRLRDCESVLPTYIYRLTIYYV